MSERINTIMYKIDNNTSNKFYVVSSKELTETDAELWIKRVYDLKRPARIKIVKIESTLFDEDQKNSWRQKINNWRNLK